ncbi:hypothetical protein B0H13DRAFT_2547684 [Mycena leptocephala]|nr:hypothetical protein B0H13DRAFT_2547684 [Mycena leptocephala]
MGEKRRREVMDYVLVPKSELDGEIQASNRGEWGPGVMQNGFEYANHRRKAGDIPRSPRPQTIKSTHPEATAVHTSLEDALNDAWSRNERAGTIPGVGRKVHHEEIRDDIYQPPEHRGRSSGQTRYPAYSDLQQVVIKEPMVYYATMYDCHTSAPVVETFVGADGGVVVQARPLQKKQRVSVGEEGPSPTVLSMPAQAARIPELDVDKVDAAPNSDAIFNLGVSTEAAMPQAQPSYAHSDSSNGSRVDYALHRHAPAPSNYQHFPPSRPSSSYNCSSMTPTPQTYDEFFALLFNHSTS